MYKEFYLKNQMALILKEQNILHLHSPNFNIQSLFNHHLKTPHYDQISVPK